MHAVGHDIDGKHAMHHDNHVVRTMGHDIYARHIISRDIYVRHIIGHDKALTDLQYIMACDTCCSFSIRSNSRAVLHLQQRAQRKPSRPARPLGRPRHPYLLTQKYQLLLPLLLAGRICMTTQQVI